jgi:hypothetical protein
MFLEADDAFDIDQFGECLRSGNARTREWLDIMSQYMVPAPGNAPDMLWTVLPEVCTLEPGGAS